MEEIEWFQDENSVTAEHFDLQKILDFQLQHDVQVIRGSDYQYMCYIDGEVCATGLTPLFALMYGVNLHIATH